MTQLDICTTPRRESAASSPAGDLSPPRSHANWVGWHWRIATECSPASCLVMHPATSDRRACGRTLGAAVAAPSVVDFLEIDEQPEAIVDLVERLMRYAAGEPVDFSDVRVDERHLTRFGRRIVQACRRIPAGQTRSYGQLAAACGSPGAARAVGQVMAKNRYPLVVPCHRVIGCRRHRSAASPRRKASR